MSTAATKRFRAFVLSWLISSASAYACSSHPALLPVSLPDMSRADPGVQAQARERFAAVTAKSKASDTASADLANAYGQLGMLLQAAEYYDAAEPCYLNAQTLSPDEFRWPYYLAHLHKSKGATAKAEMEFARALQLRPDDVPALIWLGRLYLDEGRIDEAEPLFTRARARAPNVVAVLAGLGRVALARRDYGRAAELFEQALALDPESDSLHSPLAMAYRGLGALDKAEPHLRQWRNREVLVPDPLRQELDLLLDSGLSNELRGVRALEAKDFTAAAGFFRRGLALAAENTPLRRSLQHKLGTALFMTGDVAAAQEQFESVVRSAPPGEIDESSAKAHYSLAVLRASHGSLKDAIAHLTEAVKYQPNYAEAQLALADALRRDGRADRALDAYRETLRINPGAAQARIGYAIALAQLGRYQAARDWLVDATKHDPDRPEIAHALARLLVAAPDDRVRDGRRARTILEQLLKTQKTTDLGETVAMAHAELGDFDQAIATQRGVLAAARDAGLQQAVERMTENLRLYERRQPCRTPWRRDEVAVISSDIR